MKNTTTKKILNHLTNYGVISETEAIIRYMIKPSKLSTSVNELRSYGFTISKTDHSIDNEYDLLNIPDKN